MQSLACRQGISQRSFGEPLGDEEFLGAASQNALRMTFVLEAEAISFDTEVVAYLPQFVGRDATSPLFHLPLRTPRYSDTLQYHGQPGSLSFPL